MTQQNKSIKADKVIVNGNCDCHTSKNKSIEDVVVDKVVEKA